MGKNTGKGSRQGQVKGREQFLNPQNERWTKTDTDTGKIIDVKSGRSPFKGVKKK